jgi:hypothetical protein
LISYPIYIVSKGRFENCLTAKLLSKDNVPFHLVVEPQEADKYIQSFGNESVYILPFSNQGKGSIPARNWVWEHSKELGFNRHWILDDNLRSFRRLYKGKRIPCEADIALKVCEDFTDRYTNVGLSGLNYYKFVLNYTQKPFYQNVHVYSCILVNNAVPYRWRGRYNEDTDLCLQVLSGNYCTILINAFMCDKVSTMTMTGGNTDELYVGDGRLKMARSLERKWPGVVTTQRRFKRPQHVINQAWKNFDTKLIMREDFNPSSITDCNYDMKLKELKPIKSNKFMEFYKANA